MSDSAERAARRITQEVIQRLCYLRVCLAEMRLLEEQSDIAERVIALKPDLAAIIREELAREIHPGPVPCSKRLPRTR